MSEKREFTANARVRVTVEAACRAAEKEVRK